MKAVINTDVDIPSELFEVLCLFETYCSVTGKLETTEEEVKEWVKARSDSDVADQFKPEYMYS
jgi:hypothetical protein